MSLGVSRLKQILQSQGPKTARELNELGVAKEVISRAVNAGEVLDDAAARQGSRYVALYYLDEQQLQSRTDIEVYLPQSGLVEQEKEAIKQYLDAHHHQTYIRLGNAERDLGFSLTANSSICTRRRDLLFELAKEKGIEVYDGFDESAPALGSKRWWACHRDAVVGQVEKCLSGLPSGFEPPDEDDLFSFFKGDFARALKFGCRIGGICFLPNYEKRVMDEQLRELLKTPALQHAGAETRATLENMLESAVQHCNKALTITKELWKKIHAVVASLFHKAKQGWGVPFAHAVYFLYHLMYRKAMGMDAQKLEVRSDTMIVYPPGQVLLDAKGAVELDALKKYTEFLNAFVEYDPLHKQLRDSLREVKLSDEQLHEFIDRIKKLIQTWRVEGLSGECEICRGVTPRPEMFAHMK